MKTEKVLSNHAVYLSNVLFSLIFGAKKKSLVLYSLSFNGKFIGVINNLTVDISLVNM